MDVCERCGRAFVIWEAADEFESCTGKSAAACYDQLGRTLCGDCAVEEYEKGCCFESCECCGKLFYPAEELARFAHRVSRIVPRADMYERGTLCAECAAAQLLDRQEE